MILRRCAISPKSQDAEDLPHTNQSQKRADSEFGQAAKQRTATSIAAPQGPSAVRSCCNAIEQHDKTILALP